MKKTSENNGNFIVKPTKNCSNRQSNSLIKVRAVPPITDTPRHHPLAALHHPNTFQRFGQGRATIGRALEISIWQLSARSGGQDGRDEGDAGDEATRKTRRGAKKSPIEETKFDDHD